eukprot:m.36035 g.36035  ORF g.36035 m.36035 type:complete len:188 (-) comp9951_c0_seq1:1856-2419(-)
MGGGDFLCGKPIEDPRAHLQAREWETTMMHAGCDNPGGCALACFFPCCMAYSLRKRALDNKMADYKCCQGYICPNCVDCFVPDQSQCPEFCLCLEVTFFQSCAISATRIFVQEQRQIITDPCDIKIIACNNAMQILTCICRVLAHVNGIFGHVARLIQLAADIVYCKWILYKDGQWVTCNLTCCSVG